jgi:copper chaperone CopZ
MKKLILSLLAVFFALGVFAGDTLKLSLKAEKGALDAGKASEVLLKVKGVSEATVDTTAGTAVIIYDASKAKVDEILKAFKAAGYKAEVVEKEEFEEWGDDSIDGFHSVLHAMHKAVDAGKIDQMKASLPKLLQERDALVKTMTQDASDITTPAEKKCFQEKSAITEALSKQVDELKEALDGTDKTAVVKAFREVHESFYKLMQKLEAEEDMDDAPPPKPKETAKPEPKASKAPAAEPSAEKAPAKDEMKPSSTPASEKAAPKHEKTPTNEGK